MAGELGVELARLEGSGPGGRIVKADVQAASESGTATETDGAQADGAEAEAPEEKGKAEEREEPQKGEAGPKGEAEIHELTRLQQTVSRRMAESKATAPDFSISLTVDMTDAVELRARLKEVADPAPSFNDMVVKAAATALREYPRVNGAYRDGKFELYEKVNIGVAVAAKDALVVPTIFDADRKSLGQIARDARAVIEKVRDKTITPARALGRHLHRLQPRHVRNRALHGDHQPAAGLDPDRRGAGQAAGCGRQRPHRGARPDDALAGVRPPHPLRRGRRAVPGAREGTARAAAVAGALKGYPLSAVIRTLTGAHEPRRSASRRLCTLQESVVSAHRVVLTATTVSRPGTESCMRVRLGRHQSTTLITSAGRSAGAANGLKQAGVAPSRTSALLARDGDGC